MTDETSFPLDRLKEIIDDVLSRLPPAEEELQGLGPIAEGEEVLEEETRVELNSKYQDAMDWAAEIHNEFAAMSELSPNHFQQSELNYARTVLNRYNLVCSNVVKLTRTEQEKAMDEMQFHMMQANAAANNPPKN